MNEDLTEVLIEYFAANSGPDGVPPDYGIIATFVPPDNQTIRLTLTFKTGCSYCCGEPQCHFTPDWGRLRSIASQFGLLLESPLTIRLRGVVQAGSTFTSTVQAGGPARNEPYEYDQTYSEDETASKSMERE